MLLALAQADDPADRGPYEAEESSEDPEALAAEETSPTWQRHLWPHLETLGLNLSLHGFTRYVLREDWAMISGESIKTNLTSPWTWDSNQFTVNQIGHPIQGGASHTAARLHGLSYYEALPAVALGSLEWEVFFETERPSINDQITTMWSGPATGEMLLRLSQALLEPSVSGRPRFFRELGAGLINPIHGVERLATGKAWRPGPTPHRVPMQHELSFGYDKITRLGQGELGSHRFHYDLAYGDAFARTRLMQPFDVFDFRFDLTLTDAQTAPGLVLFTTGGLAGRRVELFGSPDNFLGLFQHTTYVETPTYNLGNSALGPGWWGRFPMGGQWELHTKWLIMATLMGALDSAFSEPLVGRDYVLGPGATSHLRVEFVRQGVGHVFIEARRYWVSSITEPVGQELLGYQQLGFIVDVWRHWGLGVNAVLTDRSAFYQDYDDFSDTFLATQAHLTKGL